MECTDEESEELKKHKQVILGFFRECKDKGLLDDNKKKEIFNRDIETRYDVSILVDKALVKISEMHLENPEKMTLNNKEHSALQFSRNIAFLREATEELKIILQKFLGPTETNPQMWIGQIITKICEKLPSNNGDKIKQAFQVELRNAISHQDYCYKLDADGIESIT